MAAFAVSLASVLIGVIGTIVISRYYYQRSVAKELTPFLHFQANVLDSIDDEVKSDLEIAYRGVKVDRLQQVQFLIANTGERAIGTPIQPLTMRVDGDIEIVDGNILHIHPEGREVTLNVLAEETGATLEFPLMNSDDFFVVKFLIRGAPKRSDFQFSIAADDLPPRLTIQPLGYEQIATDAEDSKPVLRDLVMQSVAVLITLVISLLLLTLTYYADGNDIPEFQSPTWAWLNEVPFMTLGKLVGYAWGGIFALVAVLVMVAGLSGVTVAKPKRFRLPRKIAGDIFGHEVIVQQRLHRLESGFSRTRESDS